MNQKQFIVGEWSTQRVGLFVDTQNLYYSARDYYAAHLNYQVLLEACLRERQLRHASAYIVERGSNAHNFVTKLSTLGYRVYRREVMRHHTDKGEITLEGDWDMGIAADMVRCWEHIDVLALASGDGDFVPILQLAQERGCRVEILAFQQSCHQGLVDIADRFIDIAKIEDIFV